MRPDRDELTWLGQAGFRLRSGGVSLLVDPFFSEHDKRIQPAPELSVVADADWILVTHEHLDHLDMGFIARIAAERPGVKVVLPAPIAGRLTDVIPAEKVYPVGAGSCLNAGGVEIDVVPAIHGVTLEDGFSDGSGHDGRVRFVGYVIRTPGRTYYHSGDSIVTSELVAALADKRVDVALLPINGRDFFREERGLVGNMNVREAVGFAKAMGASVLVPMHWDLFRGNTERPSAVVDEAVDVGSLHVLVMGQLVPCFW